MNAFPHICYCGAPCFNSAVEIQCTNSKCQNYVDLCEYRYHRNYLRYGESPAEAGMRVCDSLVATTTSLAFEKFRKVLARCAETTKNLPKLDVPKKMSGACVKSEPLGEDEGRWITNFSRKDYEDNGLSPEYAKYANNFGWFDEDKHYLLVGPPSPEGGDNYVGIYVRHKEDISESSA